MADTYFTFRTSRPSQRYGCICMHMCLCPLGYTQYVSQLNQVNRKTSSCIADASRHDSPLDLQHLQFPGQSPSNGFPLQDLRHFPPALVQLSLALHPSGFPSFMDLVSSSPGIFESRKIVSLVRIFPQIFVLKFYLVRWVDKYDAHIHNQVGSPVTRRDATGVWGGCMSSVLFYKNIIFSAWMCLLVLECFINLEILSVRNKTTTILKIW